MHLLVDSACCACCVTAICKHAQVITNAAATCRYEGEFKDGQRHGYGALYYATGAKYEGEWQREQKHGRGVFIFEDGTVFDGMFADDQPVCEGGNPWGPVGSGVKLRVHDLLEDSDNKQVLPASTTCVQCTACKVIAAVASASGQNVAHVCSQDNHSVTLHRAILAPPEAKCHPLCEHLWFMCVTGFVLAQQTLASVQRDFSTRASHPAA